MRLQFTVRSIDFPTTEASRTWHSAAQARHQSINTIDTLPINKATAKRLADSLANIVCCRSQEEVRSLYNNALVDCALNRR